MRTDPLRQKMKDATQSGAGHMTTKNVTEEAWVPKLGESPRRLYKTYKCKKKVLNAFALRYK